MPFSWTAFAANKENREFEHISGLLLLWILFLFFCRGKINPLKRLCIFLIPNMKNLSATSPFSWQCTRNVWEWQKKGRVSHGERSQLRHAGCRHRGWCRQLSGSHQQMGHNLLSCPSAFPHKPELWRVQWDQGSICACDHRGWLQHHHVPNLLAGLLVTFGWKSVLSHR